MTTELSDFHNLALAMTNGDNLALRAGISNSLRVRNVSSYLVFEEIFLHRGMSQLKRKVTRVYHVPSVT